MMKEYDVRIVDHGDGTFSVASAFLRNTDAAGLVPVSKTAVINLLRAHFENEAE